MDPGWGRCGRSARTTRRLVPILAVLASLVACSDDAPATSPMSSDVPETTGAATTAGVAEPELRAELLAMMDEDQAEMTGGLATNNYRQRTDRLVEILDEHGWPTFDLVGEDGSTAAWVIAQHADLDPDVQQRALELLRSAAEAGQASAGDLAYLEDRVAVAAGEPQRYGTQMGCTEDGTPLPATPIADEAAIEQLRAEAGLAPYADYIAEMTEVCAGAG